MAMEDAVQCRETKEVIFSSKRSKPQHAPLTLDSEAIARKTEHKHLGMILDENLNFKSNIREAILKAKRGIGMIKLLSDYVSRNVLDQIYKLYIRHHLDYGGVIYHRHDPQMSLDITKRLKQTQYSAALAITGAWRGTSRPRLYEELGWESLHDRRWFRRLCHFFKLRKSQRPAYLYEVIPDVRKVPYSLVGQRYPRIDIMDRLIPFCIYSTRSVLLSILSHYFISVTN